jgi:REP element-mobilizing transposase RayT
MRKEPLYPDETYHVYNRGVDHGDIFFNRDNYLFLLRRLRHYCPPALGRIIAYCLMPNHYHLIVRVLSEEFGLRVMQPLLVSYTKAINKQQDRSGHLFQGPFHARRVTTDADLIHLSRYVHLNPVAAGFVARPEDWEYSSFRDYIGLRPGSLPEPDAVLVHFSSAAAYAEYVCGPADPRAGLLKELLIDE